MSQRKQVIALLRVSTDSQDLARQRADVKRLVASHDLELIRTEEVGGVSGRHVLQDPQFQGIFRDLKRADVAGVAISALDRLFRPDFYGDFGILDHFRSNKKLIFSAKEGVLDPSSDAGFMMSLMSGAQAGMEWRELRRRTMAAKQLKRLEGKHVDGAIGMPRGVAYSKTDGWSYVEPYRTRILKAYDLLFAGKTWREIARIGGLTAEGFRRSLMNPIWCGIRRYGVEAGEPQDVPLPIEPLISRDRWNRAQELIAERHHRWKGRPRVVSPFLGIGVLRCSCGKPWYGKADWRPGQRHDYFCSSRAPRGKGCGAPWLPQKVVDAAIEQVLTAHLMKPKLLLKILDGMKRNSPRKDTDSAGLKRELARLEARRKRLLDAMLDGLVTKQEYAEHLRAIESKRQELQTMMPAQAPAIESPRLVERICSAFREFKHLALVDKRELLRRAVKEIRIENHSIPFFTLHGGFLGEKLSTPSNWR